MQITSDIFTMVFGFYSYFSQSEDVIMDLSKLFQCSVMEELKDIMSDSVKSMSVDNTSEWWAQRTRLNIRMKVKYPVFIAQLVEHCLNTVEAPKTFFWGATSQYCLNCNYSCDGHVFISFVFLQFTSCNHFILCFIPFTG